ncbi:hypothetical protein [Tichowtungia aerotolerans]|uniref:Uncharacterized protein n=1 Tax=Tichowtungia aerotolerans TaxID=2697043 RepID=A0A6P1MA60_9BACT|nr:hypothetical protein [Tichowtungia aerotolerans]QHI70817.1 hypothetical protein GT409_15665 [Tichowtungia aerotolerans]
MMKIKQTILALIALITLGMPCAHSAGHHAHADSSADGICNSICRGCSHEEPCVKDSSVMVPPLAVTDLPAPQLPVISVLKPVCAVFTAPRLPNAEFRHLLTVQLLI